MKMCLGMMLYSLPLPSLWLEFPPPFDGLMCSGNVKFNIVVKSTVRIEIFLRIGSKAPDKPTVRTRQNQNIVSPFLLPDSTHDQQVG